MADFVSITEVTSNLSSILRLFPFPYSTTSTEKINFEDRKIQSNLRGEGKGSFNEGMRGEI